MAVKKSYEEWLLDVKNDHNAILSVPKKYWTKEICYEAVNTDYSALNYLTKKYLSKEICILAFKKSPTSIRYVRKNLRGIFKKYISEEIDD